MTNTFTIGLLATAVSASLAMANGGEEEKNKFQDKSPVSFKAGSGITFDGGDDFSLNLKNRLQIQYSNTFGDDVTDGESQNFDITRARTSLSGHAYNKNITYKLQLDWAQDDNNIKDAWAQWNFVHGEGSTVGVRIGQSKTFHGLESTGTSGGTYFNNYAIATQFFANTRSRGAWLHGNHMESKLRWTAGAQNGGVSNVVDGDDTADNQDNELVYVASANLDPMGDFVGGGKTYESYTQGDLEGSADLKGTVGVGVAIDNRGSGRTSNVLDAEESTQFNLNTAWKVSNFWAGFDYFDRTDDNANSLPAGTRDDRSHDGYQLTVGYTLPKSGDSNLQWGIGVRYSSISLDESTDAFSFAGLAGDDEGTQMGIVINAFYHGHGCKTQVELNNVEVGDKEAQQIIVGFQIII